MIEISLEKNSSVDEIKEALYPLLKNDEYNFSWLNNILQNSLDTWVIGYLNTKSPITSAFFTLDLNDHMSEATNLINSCTSIRNEIFNLENQALTTALEYVQIINSLENEKLLGRLNINALLKQSGEGSYEMYEKALQMKIDNIKYNVKAKISLHNQFGNSLNYGERIEYLKEIYGDNIKNIYERLIAIKRTLKYSFNQNTKPIPNYIEISNNLYSLIKWMRETIYDFETISQNDYILSKTITVSGNATLNAENIEDKFKELADQGYVDLNISTKDFGISNNNLAIRILGVSLNIIGCYDKIDEINLAKQTSTSVIKANNEVKREHQLFNCEIIPPEQNISLDKDNIFSSTKEQELLQEEFLKKVNKNPELLVTKHKIEDLKVVKDYTKPLGMKIYFQPESNTESIVFPKKLIFGDLQPIFKSSINTNQLFLSEYSIKNITPIGQWRIHIKNATPPRLDPVKSASVPPRLDDKTWGIQDISLTFRLGVRKNMPLI